MLEQAVVDLLADRDQLLPRLGRERPFDAEVVGVVDGRLGPQRAAVLEVLLDLGMLVTWIRRRCIAVHLPDPSIDDCAAIAKNHLGAESAATIDAVAELLKGDTPVGWPRDSTRRAWSSSSRSLFVLSWRPVARSGISHWTHSD